MHVLRMEKENTQNYNMADNTVIYTIHRDVKNKSLGRLVHSDADDDDNADE